MCSHLTHISHDGQVTYIAPATEALCREFDGLKCVRGTPLSPLDLGAYSVPVLYTLWAISISRTLTLKLCASSQRADSKIQNAEGHTLKSVNYSCHSSATDIQVRVFAL